jgi:hypothetical protein
MDFVAFVEKQIGEVAAVLASDASDEGFFHEMGFILTKYAGISALSTWKLIATHKNSSLHCRSSDTQHEAHVEKQ